MLLPHEAHAVVKKNRRGIAAPFPRHSAPKRRRPYRGTSFHRRYMRSLTCVLPCALFRRRGLSNAPRCVFYAAVYSAARFIYYAAPAADFMRQRRRFSVARAIRRGILLLYHKSSLCRSPILGAGSAGRRAFPLPPNILEKPKHLPK